MRLKAFLVALAVGAVGYAGACDSSTETETTTPVGGSGAGGGGTGGEPGVGGQPSWEISTGSGSCNSVLYEPPTVSSPHVDACSDLDHLSTPPTSGPHYPKWADYKTYTEPVPRGFLIHAMEHGAVLLLYNCSNCDTEIMAMQTWIDAQAVDSACIPPVLRRTILSPAPWLDVPFAIAAWGFMLKADCFDEAQADDIYADRYAKGPEDLCGAGIDPFDPLLMIPSNCPE
jgi:hypothetical protein